MVVFNLGVIIVYVVGMGVGLVNVGCVSSKVNVVSSNRCISSNG